MRDLLVIAPAPGSTEGDDLILDKKFVDGMRFYSDRWGGRTGCLLPRASTPLPFAGRFRAADLPFDVRMRPAGHHVVAEDLDGYDVILCGGDNAEYLHLAPICRDLGKKLYYVIEYIPETRRQIVMLERGRTLPRKLKSLLDIQRHERRRRRAFAAATGIQANGYPAAELYRQVNADTLLYLDNRIGSRLLVTEEEMAARRAHQSGGGPLRLIHSGRLEPMKGSHDLIPIARRLRDAGTDFTLDIFGGGSLEAEIRRDIAAHGLADHVRLQGSVDFDSELVPFARTRADIYLSCHRQSDPSCSYVENMGCGLAVAGYDNRMWAALARDSGAGWVVPLGDWAALADRIAAVAADRATLTAACERARDFAAAHLFEDEFTRRIAHLKAGTA